MHSPKAFYSIILLLLTLNLFAQVSGVVTDSNTGKPVKACEVFINNSSISTTANNDGYFELSNIDIGFYDLVIYHEKYEIFKSSLHIKSNKAYKLNLSINPLTEKVRSSRAKQDEEWISNFNWFRQGFLGSNNNTALCTILNEKVLSFQRDGYQLQATASAPLVIENKALGYTLTYYLQTYTATEQSADFHGLLKFEVESTDDYYQRNTWNRNRQIAFWGSTRHLLQALTQGNYQEQGFELTDGKGNALKADSLIRPSRIDGYANIHLPESTNVKYLINSDLTGMQANAAEKQQSMITKYGSVDVSPYGILLNNESIKIEGTLNKVGLALMVPINYKPEVTIEDEKLDWQNFALLQEKVYIHTDRDYYYPRETIWFKAYLGFSMPILRDTLSRLLYVEFISPAGKIISSKNVKIRNGIGWGAFVLPPTMDDGEYYIRAYTNWMRNYEDNFYVRPVPILDWNQNLVTQDVIEVENSSIFDVNIAADKNNYTTREKISIAIDVKDQSGKVITGNMSIAVVDAQATTEIPEIDNILTPGLLAIGKKESKNEYFESIEHFMERGISFRGKVVEKNSPVTASVDIIQGNMDNLINVETDANGEFLVTGLDFSDSLNFAFKSTNAKGKPFGKVELLKKEIVPFTYGKPKLNLEFRSDNALPRVQNTYDLAKNTIVLKEVVITDQAIKNENKTMPKIYGKPDYVIEGSKMGPWMAGMDSPIVGLQGRVPGLRMVEYVDEFGMRRQYPQIRGGTSSISGPSIPLILVDGMPMDLQSIQGMSPNTIDRVEVITRAVATFGSRGTNGVIAIYTKSGLSPGDSNPDYLAFKIGGYTRSFPFTHPDYGEIDNEKNPDFRTTIYWNPYLTLSEEKPAAVEFYTADIETQYKIIVEGMTMDGKPFRGVSFITISR